MGAFQRIPLPIASDVRSAKVELVIDRRHYDEVVLRAIGEARVSVWISTANLKDVHIEAPIGTRARARGEYMSMTERFEELVGRGVEVRILHGARDAPRLAATLVSTAYNVGIAAGAAIGAALLSAGVGYALLPATGIVTGFIALLLASTSIVLSRRGIA